MRTAKDLWCGVVRHPFGVLGEAFVTFSVLWTLTEALNHFIPAFDLKGKLWLTVFAFISGGWEPLPTKKESRIAWRLTDITPTDETKWPELHEWLRSKLEILHKVLSPRVKKLELSVDIESE